ncbi:MAG: SpoIIE family protein phosphatase [Verrucomicrobiae bacterium]|nr:SpoIIE family protein phosphatase [Verrucomicrobiae bacterium]
MSTLTSVPGNLLRLTCHCELAAIREVARSVRGFLERQGLSTPEADAWELICAEAGNNAVEHAPPHARHLPIEVSIEISPTAVELRVIDHTSGFELPPSSELPDPLDEGGRGLFLIRSLSDSQRYWRGTGENCLVVIRQRAAPEPESAPPDPSVQQSMLEATLHTMTEELAASYESLSAIFRFTEELIRSGGDDRFMDRWLLELKQITGADWYVLRLLDESRGVLDVARTSHPDMPFPPLPLAGTLSPGGSLELRAVHGRQDVWFDPSEPPPQGDPLRCLSATLAGLAHPLFVAGQLVGSLAVGRYAGSHPFTAGQVNIVHTLSDFLGIQIRNAQFQKSTLQAQLLDRDYEVASRIQRQLLPKQHPRNGRWATLGFCESAQRVGGDFYDIIEVGSNGLLLAVADVMGKGLPAALFATVFRTLLRARPELARSPGPFVDWLNENLVEELGELEMFITAQLAYVNLSTRELRVAGAGHPPLLLAGVDHPAEEVLSCGPPLGICSSLEFHEERRILPPGARLLLYTDGVTEATYPDGVQVGTGPLIEILNTSILRRDEVERTIARIGELQGDIDGERPAADDRTLLLLQEDVPSTPPINLSRRHACHSPHRR